MSEPPSSPYSDQGLIRSVYGPSLLHAAGYGMLAPAIPLFADQLSISLGLIGALVAVQGVSQMAADIPTGLLVGRIGGRGAMALGVACSAVAGIVLGLSTDSTHLFAAVRAARSSMPLCVSRCPPQTSKYWPWACVSFPA